MWRTPDEYRVLRCQTLAAVVRIRYDSDIYVRTDYGGDKFVADGGRLTEVPRAGFAIITSKTSTLCGLQRGTGSNENALFVLGESQL